MPQYSVEGGNLDSVEKHMPLQMKSDCTGYNLDLRNDVAEFVAVYHILQNPISRFGVQPFYFFAGFMAFHITGYAVLIYIIPFTDIYSSVCVGYGIRFSFPNKLHLTAAFHAPLKITDIFKS